MMTGVMLDVGSEKRGTYLYNVEEAVCKRELTKFQCQLSPKIMHGKRCSGVYTTAGRPLYSGL